MSTRKKTSKVNTTTATKTSSSKTTLTTTKKTDQWKSQVIQELMKLPGVGRATALKLFESGYASIRLLAITSPRILAEETGIGEKTAQKIIEAARKVVKMNFVSALDYLAIRKEVKRITTGSKSLDTLLGGGIPTSAITEFAGEFRTGKTQIAHTISITVQLPEEKGGLNGCALYVDTEGTFRPERLIPIARRFGLDPEEALSRVYVVRTFSSDQQMEVVRKLRSEIPKLNIKVVIVDSLTAHFRAEYTGIDSLAVRQQLLNKHLHDLQRIAWGFNIAVVVTNQVVATPGILFGNPQTPIGGHVVAHNVTYRVFLRKGKGNTRVAKILDAPDLPESECTFIIADDGIRDS